MAEIKQRGAIDGGFGRGVPVTEREDQIEDEEFIDDDVEEFFEADEASERRRDPLRRPV